VIFGLHFGSVYLSSGKLVAEIFSESAGALSLSLMNKNCETFLFTYQRRFFIRLLLTIFRTKKKNYRKYIESA
jgi:hypothetical protein